MPPISKAEIAELRTLANYATPTPWGATDEGLTTWEILAPCQKPDGGEEIGVLADVYDESNAAFIAAARNHIATLLDIADLAHEIRQQADEGQAYGYVPGAALRSLRKLLTELDATPAGAVVAEPSGATAGRDRHPLLTPLPESEAALLRDYGVGPHGEDDDAAGTAWFNSLTEAERAGWLKRANSAKPADAWAAFKRGDPDPGSADAMTLGG